MAKKRKSKRPAEPTGPKEYDPADARLGPINSYEDIADSEDEYFMNQDRIDLDDEPKSKRQRRLEEDDAILEYSDEEVLRSEGEDSEDDVPAAKKQIRKKGAPKEKDDDSEKEGEAEAEQDEGWWGASRKDYYHADQAETEADALEEEAEAKRLQQKKLSKMAEEDFMFDEDEWLTNKEPEKEEEEEIVTEVLKDAPIPANLTPEEQYKLLVSRYPEFEHLAAEFQDLQPRLIEAQREAEGKSTTSIFSVRYWVLGCYVAALASYFAILTSPARDENGVQKTIPPSELRDHEVMETLVSCREMWLKVKDMKSSEPEPPVLGEIPASETNTLPAVSSTGPELKKLNKKSDKEIKKAEKKRKERLLSKEMEQSLADLDDLPLSIKKSRKKRDTAASKDEDSHSDFGEEDALDADTAEAKAQRKKSLRFYTSQIVQKANRRAGAGRDAGGDADIPYRERLRDRQARLNAEAERRGRKESKFGDDLDANAQSDDEDAATAAAVRNDDDEYYDMIAAAAGKKKDDKSARFAALAEAGKADKVVEMEVVGEDGKRKITYAIEKNKGLTPRRKKENRNPRVKKRMQYHEKMKKLRSRKPMYRGQPEKGYQGEKTGIKAGLIRSTKL